MLRRPSERSLADRGVEGRTRVSRVFNQQTHGGFLSHGTQIKNWSILKFFCIETMLLGCQNFKKHPYGIVAYLGYIIYHT